MLTVRSARAADIPGVLRIWTAAEAEPSVTDDESSLRALFSRDADALMVAEVEGAAVGTLIATWDGWRGHFYRLAVLPQHRRRRVASELVHVAEQRLRALGAKRLNAIVVDGQPWETGFWRAAGYEAQSDRIRFVKNTG